MTMKNTTLSFRRYAELLDDITYQGEFRAEKAAQYPDDKRNARAAEGLAEMAVWFKRQDNDSPLMTRLGDALDSFYADPSATESFLPTVTDRLSRFRFHNYQPETCEEFFEELITDIEEHVARSRA
jgi:hypothetical protein